MLANTATRTTRSLQTVCCRSSVLGARSYATPAKDEIVGKLQAQLKESMREKDKFKSQVLKSALSDIQAMQHHETPPPTIQTLLSSLSKRKEALKIYESQNRPDLVEQYAKEIDILETIVPEDAKELSLEELGKMVKDVMEELGVLAGSDPKAGLGKVMKEVKARAGLRAQNLGKQLAETVKKALA